MLRNYYLWAGALVAGLALLGRPAVASDAASDRATLRGLSGTAVLIETVGTEAQEQGLSAETLQIDVEKRLKDAGLKILCLDDALKEKGTPVLYVLINALSGRTLAPGIFSYGVSVEMKQRVTLARDTKTSTTGSTWSVATAGLAGDGKIASACQQAVDDLTDRFVVAYKSVATKR